jgi:hypothetical protein
LTDVFFDKVGHQVEEEDEVLAVVGQQLAREPQLGTVLLNKAFSYVPLEDAADVPHIDQLQVRQHEFFSDFPKDFVEAEHFDGRDPLSCFLPDSFDEAETVISVAVVEEVGLQLGIGGGVRHVTLGPA